MKYCGRCNKELPGANSTNAKYIINPNDPKTHRPTMVEVKRPVDEWDEDDIMANLPRIIPEIDIKGKTKDLMAQVKGKGKLKQADIESQLKALGVEVTKERQQNISQMPDKWGRREIVEKKTEDRAKTMLICPECLRDNDEIIW